MRTLLRKKNTSHNEKLAACDSAYCLHFSALAFYVFQHRLSFMYFCFSSLLSLFLGWQWGRRDVIRDATTSVPRESIFLPPLFHPAVQCKSHVAILRSRIKCANTLKHLRISNAVHRYILSFGARETMGYFWNSIGHLYFLYLATERQIRISIS